MSQVMLSFHHLKELLLMPLLLLLPLLLLILKVVMKIWIPMWQGSVSRANSRLGNSRHS